MTNCARDADAARDDSGLITRCGQSKCRALVMATRQADETTAVPAVRSDDFPPCCSRRAIARGSVESKSWMVWGRRCFEIPALLRILPAPSPVERTPPMTLPPQTSQTTVTRPSVITDPPACPQAPQMTRGLCRGGPRRRMAQLEAIRCAISDLTNIWPRPGGPRCTCTWHYGSCLTLGLRSVVTAQTRKN